MIMSNITINIAKEYTKTPGGRYIMEGPFSGEDFRERRLIPAVKKAMDANCQILIILDGGYGYAPSFLEEAFGGLIRNMRNQQIISMIHIISDEEPKLIEDVKKYMSEAFEG